MLEEQKLVGRVRVRFEGDSFTLFAAVSIAIHAMCPANMHVVCVWSLHECLALIGEVKQAKSEEKSCPD